MATNLIKCKLVQKRVNNSQKLSKRAYIRTQRHENNARGLIRQKA